MRNALPKQPPASRPTIRDGGMVAAGGPVATLQQTIVDRIGGRDLATVALPAPDEPTSERLIRVTSRLAGPAALVAAYAGVAVWLA